MATSGITSNNAAPVGQVQDIDTSSMDIESLIIAVVQKRVEHCENQVRMKVEDMQMRNNKLKAMGELQAEITKQMKGFNNDAKSASERDDSGSTYRKQVDGAFYGQSAVSGTDASVKNRDTVNQKLDSLDKKDDVHAGLDERLKAIEAAKIPDDAKQIYRDNIAAARTAYDAGLIRDDAYAMAKGEVSYGALETLKQQVSAKVDALGNDAQLDQIALQSWTTKMTNTQQLLSTLIKKFDDTHSAIIRNT